VAKARLKTDEIERIVDMLTSWRGDLTWDRLLQRVEKLLRRSFTRQGLAKQENIQTAYQQAKDRLRTDKPRDTAPRPEIELLQNTIESLRAKIAVIEAEKGRFEEKFATWLYNARSRGISELDLNRRLPDVDRDGSVKER
jgi:predicted nuclease with TOPRIM domain